MHTIIKIAVVSILAMFAIVGVVSSSKAGTSVFFDNGKIALSSLFTQGTKIISHMVKDKKTIIFHYYRWF